MGAGGLPRIHSLKDFMDRKELRIRMEERIRVYSANPNAPVTYADLSQVIEWLVDILDNRPKSMGFKT